MARPLRLEFPGAVYHITSRGNARQPIFESNGDREFFLTVLQDVVERFNWLCHAYCLMDNHYHLLAETVDGRLSQGMRHLNGLYSQQFNRQHGRVGHVFQGRYKAILVERESYLLELCRYVVLNPIRAGIVKDPREYRWSSYRATAGLKARPALLTVDWILGQFGKQRTQTQKQYRQFVLDGMEEPPPWLRLKAQSLLGGREFIERIAPALKDKSQIPEIPKEQRLAYRPALQHVLDEKTTNSKDERNEAILKAYIEYGYTLSEIARYLGLHYTTISKIVKQRKIVTI